MEFDAQTVWANVRQAGTEDLLERCTAFREGMEPEALEIIEAELHRRGVDEQAILAHAQRQPLPLLLNGLPASCSFCSRAAVSQGWGWHHLWGLVPVFPRKFRYCAEHQPG